MPEFPNISVRVPYTIFGNGSVEKVGKEAAKMGAKKALVVTGRTVGSSGLVERARKPLEQSGLEVAAFSEVEPNTPMENIVATAKAARDNHCDLMVGIGGGSTMDNVKTASVLAACEDIEGIDVGSWVGVGKTPRQSLPKILIPTTAGTGAEWTTSTLTMTGGNKVAILSPALMPDLAIVDPLMTLDMPPKLTADSGMDALTHAIEAYTAPHASLYSDMIAERAISLIGANLRRAYARGADDLEARYNISFASMIACNAMTSAGTHLIHGMAHALQSVMHNITHGQSCSLMLCAVMEFNMIAGMEKTAGIAGLLGENVEGPSLKEQAETAIETVRALSVDIGMPQSLSEIGMKREDIARAVDILFDTQAALVKQGPRHCSREEAAGIFESAL